MGDAVSWGSARHHSSGMPRLGRTAAYEVLELTGNQV